MNVQALFRDGTQSRPVGVSGYSGEYKSGHMTYAEIRDSDGSLYMRRWYILQFKKAFSIRIHHIMRPDMDRWPHDHPWSFLSIILRGGYIERWCKRNEFSLAPLGKYGIYDGAMFWWNPKVHTVRRFNFKSTKDVHMIDAFLREGGAWTLVITGPERREWGFMTDKGWVSRKELGLGAAQPAEFGPEPV